MSTTIREIHDGRGNPVLKTKARKNNRAGPCSSRSTSIAPETLGQRIAARRIELHLTQAQVAERVAYQPKSGRKKGAERRLSRATLAMYEIDAAEPNLRTIQAIAVALDDSPGRLAFGEAVVEAQYDTVDTPEEKERRIETVWVAPQLVRPDGPIPDSRFVPAFVINIHR